MNKKMLIGILSFALMAVSVILAVNNQNDIVLGDIILKKLGLNTWSKGNTGLHYTAMIFIVLFSVGAFLFRIYNKYLPELFIKIIPAFLLISIFVYPLTFNSFYGFIKAHSKGVHSIVYVRDESSFSYDVKKGSRYVLVDAIIALKVYDNKSHNIRMKLLPKDCYLDQYVKGSSIPSINPVTNKPESIVVCSTPGETIKLSAIFKGELKEKSLQAQGVMSGVDLMIYDKDSQAKFIE